MEEVNALKQALKNAAAQLMAHSQTIQELISANMNMRAIIHTVQEDKTALEAYVKSLMTPSTPVEAPAVEAPAEAPATEAPQVDADTVSA